MRYEVHPSGETGVVAYKNRVQDAVSSFLAENQLEYIVGISGGADSIPEDHAIGIISDLVENVKDEPCAILTGGTRGGIPEMGIQIAKASSVPTIGVFPEKGRKYALYKDIDLALETLAPTVGEGNFGTETPSFVQLLDGATIIGGSFGTLTEVSTILKVNSGRIKKSLQPIYLCPIKGTGGVADTVSLLPGIDTVSASLPDKDIRDGRGAAVFLKSKLRNK